MAEARLSGESLRFGRGSLSTVIWFIVRLVESVPRGALAPTVLSNISLSWIIGSRRAAAAMADAARVVCLNQMARCPD